MKKTSLLAILYGLKQKLRPGAHPSEDPDARVVGTFSNAETAIAFVDAGGLPEIFPYYGVGMEEGGFWVVASDVLSEEEMTWDNRDLTPVLLDGPFDNPQEATDSWVRIDRTGWESVTVQCTSTEWAARCPTKEKKLLDRPDFAWAKSRLAYWSKNASTVGGAPIVLAETKAFMKFALEHFSNAPTFDVDLSTLDVSTKLRKVHEEAHEAVRFHMRVAMGREVRN